MRLTPLLPLLLVGCAATARLYDLETGAVISIDFMRGTTHGPITIHHPAGDCVGEFSTIVSGSWGSIYSSNGNAAFGGMRDMASRGAAIATCPANRTIECEYVTSHGAGNGACRDNRGTNYRLMF